MDKMKEMEEEMSRFEQEIGVPPPEVGRPIRTIIGVNTYHNVVEQLEKQQHVYGPMPTPGPPLQFIPHQLQRQPPPLPTRPSAILSVPLDPAPPVGPITAAPANHNPIPRSVTMTPVNPVVLQSVPPGMQTSNMPPMMAPGGYMQQNPTGFPPSNQPMPHSGGLVTQHSSAVIRSSPAVYTAPPMRAKPKVEEPRRPEVTLLRPKVPATLGVKIEPEPVIPQPTAALPVSGKPIGPGVPFTCSEEQLTVKKKERKKKIIRTAGGQCWEDQSLMEWELDDFRIFCGDLGNDVTDEVLTRAFGKYPSFLKAKVVRDKRSNKTKGFGFVSFKDPQDFIRAMKEMNGKYVGSRPIKLRKSTWRERNVESVKKKMKEKQRLGLR